MELDVNAEYGGFWIRVGACLIDGVVLLIASSILVGMLRIAFPDAFSEVEYSAFSGSLLISIMYAAFLHASSWQATIGKKMLGMKVVDYSGERISFGRAVGREMVLFLPLLIFAIGARMGAAVPVASHIATFVILFVVLIPVIGVMVVGWTKRKQGLHDHIVETLVVRVRAESKPAAQIAGTCFLCGFGLQNSQVAICPKCGRKDPLARPGGVGK